MKTFAKFCFFTILFFSSVRVLAQAQYDVSGTVVNEKGEPLKSATVFIGGSERVMPTDENGRFRFKGVPQGAFQVSVHMLGYAPLTQNIFVQNTALNIRMRLEPKAITLDEVTIGRKSAWNKNYNLFKENFLGTSANARQCDIINPEIIHFSTQKGLLLAEANDFLIIKNNRLGYRIHYLLKDFSYISKDNLALYHGDFSFEELDGTEADKEKWAKNRAETYQGSFRHFLRSVYTNSTYENGFITRPLYGSAVYTYSTVNGLITRNKRVEGVMIVDRPVKFDSLMAAVSNNLISFTFKQLYITYDPRRSAGFKDKMKDDKIVVPIEKNASILRLTTPQSLIDQKGNYVDYRDFYIRGNWAIARVGDQLPVDYQPPTPAISHRNNAVDKLTIALQNWTDSLPQEKVYLHMDKPHYAPGDTIWFKGYLTTGSRHELSALSGAVYVDLLDERDTLMKALKLPVDGGMVAGNFVLNDYLPAGSYHVRAYTKWMLNAGQEYFFDRIFNVGDPAKTEKKKNYNPALQQSDVQFFPESGSLVNGITSRVAFKAIGINGLGTAISGKIIDNDNNSVAIFNTLHAGMGSFLLKPLPGKTYTAAVKFADSTTKNIVLPAAVNEGYVLTVYQPNKDSILVRIRASVTLQKSTVIMVAQSSGETIFASPVAINSAITSLWVDKKLFPGGIAQFTIFDGNNEPLNERIIFIKGDDKMQLAVKTEKMVYESKGHVQLNLSANDSEGKPTSGNFSVAVIDESQVNVDETAESTIFSHILLTSDIKGFIEKPNYYFTAETDTVNLALDNLMLTQGYRRFEWNTLSTIVNTKPVFEAEGLASSISGLVTTLTHKPLPGALIKLLSIRAGILRDTVTDANGRFKFDKMFIGDNTKFSLQAKDNNNSDKVILTVDSIPQVTIKNNKNTNNTDVTAIINQQKIHQQQVEQQGQTVKLTGLHILKQVDIKAKKIIKREDISDQQIFTVPGQSVDKVITIPDPENYNNLAMAMQGRLPGISIEPDDLGRKTMVSMRPSNDLVHTSDGTDKFKGRKMGLIVDGRKIRDPGEVDEMLDGGILMEDLAKIEVVRTNVALLNSLKDLRDDIEGYVGYVLIITKPSSARKRYYPNIANIMPKGFNKARKFYSPRYDAPAESYKQPDLRTTIYWNPYVNTDIEGKTTLDFYNADGPGTYRVVVEGINANGELGRQVYTYKVE
ncbi:carboxypeptidase regulatory-like domain-containing protein [Mucilaginibacter sp. UYCu711]|uniref:carboxypeptidase regulatory-like domain-containing protein n=1 Tax=Mucilaginibacter sp. UYCu711 TaxID=3156339 RepID=UPI003D21AADD